MQHKYKLLHDTFIRVGEKTLYFIQALVDFGEVKAGDIGGAIESEDNLSHEGKCWVYHSAKVYGKARVSGDARILDNASVYDYAKVSDRAIVSGNSKVFQRAEVYDSATVGGFASVYGNANVFGGGNTIVIGFARVHDDAWVYDVTIDGYANITRKTTQTPIVLTGFTYDVTIMDEHMSVDCQTKTFNEWRVVTREEVFAMNGKEGLKFFMHMQDTLEFLVTKYRKNQSNV